MKRLDRYLLKEMALPMLWATLGVTLVFLAFFLVTEYPHLATQSLTLGGKVQLVALQVPRFLQMAIPVGVALGSSLGMSRLSRESEITILRGSGVAIVRTILPVVAVGVVFAGLDYVIADHVMPRTEKAAQELLPTGGIGGNGSTPFSSNVPLRLRNLSVYFGSTTRLAPQRAEFHQILLIQDYADDVTKIVLAPTGDYDTGLFRFHSTYEWILKKNVLLSATPRKRDSQIRQPIELDDLYGPTQTEQQTAIELWKSAQDQRKLGQKSSVTEVQFHARFSVPAACILFAFVSPLLAVRFAKGGSVAGMILSVFLVDLYYNVYMISTDVFGKLEWMQPALAAWLPNILFAAIGILGLRNLE